MLTPLNTRLERFRRWGLVRGTHIFFFYHALQSLSFLLHSIHVVALDSWNSFLNSQATMLLVQVGQIEHGVIVHGAGMDEISPLGPSRIIELKNIAGAHQPKQYETKDYIIDPREYGFPECKLKDLQGGDRDLNALLLRQTLERGAWTRDAKKDAVTLNAGMGLYVYGLAPTIKDAFELARSTLQSGAALTKVGLTCIFADRLNTGISLRYPEYPLLQTE